MSQIENELNPNKNIEKSEIQGAWSLVKMDTGLDDNRRTRTDVKFFFCILEKHYSATRDLTPEENQNKENEKRSFMADAGTYEFNENELTVHHQIALFPVLGSMTFKCEMEGTNTLCLYPQYDKMVLPGYEKFKPNKDGKMGYGDMAYRFVFKRLE